MTGEERLLEVLGERAGVFRVSAAQMAAAILWRWCEPRLEQGLEVPAPLLELVGALRLIEVSHWPDEVSVPEDGIGIAMAHALTGVSPQYLRRVAGSMLRGVQVGPRNEWIVSRAAVLAFAADRERRVA